MLQKNLKKTTQLKQLLHSQTLSFLMEAHNGLSAKIVEETGFKGIWASGLTISASLGVRDNNEASWTQVLDVLEFMSDASSIPILLDGDTGYGNFNNMRRLVQKLEQRQVAGVCIEDKQFPKTNSFIDGEAQPLALIDEFCGKIKAAKDTQVDPDFCLVARTEAFIAGWSVEEALKRAEAYAESGADAVLIHSKKSTVSDIEQFMKHWSKKVPVVIVPTKYYSTPTEVFRSLGVSTVIWANHNLRASITAMQKVSRNIFEQESINLEESSVATVSEVFRLQGALELQEAEKKYLPTVGNPVSAVILAASQGDLGVLTEERPKTLLKVKGKSILATQVDLMNKMGIKDIVVVRGFGKEHIQEPNLKIVDNDEYENTKELYSLSLALQDQQSDLIVSFGDILYKDYILHELLQDKADVVLVVDADTVLNESNRDYVQTTTPYSNVIYDQLVSLKDISRLLKTEQVTGEFIGLCKLSPKGGVLLKNVLGDLSVDELKSESICKALTLLNEKISIQVRFIKGGWMDVNSIVDLYKAGDF